MSDDFIEEVVRRGLDEKMARHEAALMTRWMTGTGHTFHALKGEKGRWKIVERRPRKRRARKR